MGISVRWLKGSCPTEATVQVGSASSGAASTERLQEIDKTESDKNTPSIYKHVAILAEQSTKQQPHLNPTGTTTELPCDASHVNVTKTISP